MNEVAVEEGNFRRGEACILQNLEIQAPEPVTKKVEVTECFDPEPSGFQFNLQVRLGIAAVVSHEVVDGRIDFGTCRDQNADFATIAQEFVPVLEFGQILLNVFQHIDTDNGVVLLLADQIGTEAIKRLDARHFGERLVECLVWLQ